jgi:hypothetical protein
VVRRIETLLELDDYIKFMKHYQERCLREDPDGEWSASRYSAGNNLVNIFASLWRDSSVPRPELEDLRDWLGRLYEQGDSDIRTCIVQATLEQEEIRNFFSSWREDKVLAVAHEEASEWYKGGGNSSLGKPR